MTYFDSKVFKIFTKRYFFAYLKDRVVLRYDMTHAVSNTRITLQTKYLSLIIINIMKYNLISVFYYKMMMCYITSSSLPQ